MRLALLALVISAAPARADRLSPADLARKNEGGYVTDRDHRRLRSQRRGLRRLHQLRAHVLMRLVHRSLTASLLVIACGDGPGARAIRGEPTLETFERRMCACSDPGCVKQVVQDMAHWSKLVKTPRRGDDTAEIMARYNACMAKAANR